MATTNTYNPTEDTEINSAFPDTTFENKSTFEVGVSSFEDSSGPSGETVRSIMEFDVSDVTQVVNWAKLRIYTNTAAGVSGLDAKVRRVKKKPLDFDFVSWLEYGVSADPSQEGLFWTNPGGDLATNYEADWTLPTTADDWVIITVTDLVKNAISKQSGIVRLGLLRDDETTDGFADFDSVQSGASGNPPELKVNYGAF